MIITITIRDDIHALAINQRLRERGFSDCHIVECDQLATNPSLKWLSYGATPRGYVRSADGKVIDISSGLIVLDPLINIA